MNDKLTELNEAVDQAIKARRAWLDVEMMKLSELQPGDPIYDLDSGCKVGIVSSLYRFWRDRDEGVRDTSLHWDYEYETDFRCFDNTSRQAGRRFGTREQAVKEAEQRVRFLQTET